MLLKLKIRRVDKIFIRILCSDSSRAAIRPCKFCNWDSSRCKVESICFKVNKDYSAILGLYKYAIKK